MLGPGSVQFSSVAQSCPTLCDPMDCSMPGLPVHHQLLEFTQTHVHRVIDAIQPSHPLLSPSPPAPIPPSIRVPPSNFDPQTDLGEYLFIPSPKLFLDSDVTRRLLRSCYLRSNALLKIPVERGFLIVHTYRLLTEWNQPRLSLLRQTRVFSW